MDPILNWLGLPVAASAHAGEVDRIMALVHWLMLVLFVGWSVFFVYVLLRFRSGAHPKADYRGVRGGWSNWVEGGVLVAEIVLLAFFSILSGRETLTPRLRQKIRPPSCASWPSSSRGTCTIRERTACSAARTFAWSARTILSDSTATTPSAKTNLVVNGRLNLPVDRPVIVYLSSKDVIHSFALPQMRVKQDAIPGIVQPVWFTPTKTGQWDIACSQLCGLGHYRMKGVYQIQTAEEYQAWLKEESSFQ